MTRFAQASDVITAVGTELGASAWREMTQSCVDTFAALTGDRQWIHVDRRRAAAESPYGGTIVHGALVLALVPSLVSEILRVDTATMVLNVGLNRTRFRRPVRVGRRLRAAASLLSAEPALGGVLAGVQVTVETDEPAAPVCTTEQRLLIHG